MAKSAMPRVGNYGGTLKVPAVAKVVNHGAPGKKVAPSTSKINAISAHGGPPPVGSASPLAKTNKLETSMARQTTSPHPVTGQVPHKPTIGTARTSKGLKSPY